MSRIPISALANGTLFATQTFASPSNPAGVPVLTPAVGVVCEVYLHDTLTPVAVWTDEFGSTSIAQPLVTGPGGAVPGWIDPSLLPFDLVVALSSGAQTYVLAGGGGSPTPAVITGFDGGAPSTNNTDFLDGGSPSSSPTTVVDGGTP